MGVVNNNYQEAQQVPPEDDNEFELEPGEEEEFLEEEERLPFTDLAIQSVIEEVPEELKDLVADVLTRVIQIEDGQKRFFDIDWPCIIKNLVTIDISDDQINTIVEIYGEWKWKTFSEQWPDLATLIQTITSRLDEKRPIVQKVIGTWLEYEPLIQEGKRVDETEFLCAILTTIPRESIETIMEVYTELDIRLNFVKKRESSTLLKSIKQSIKQPVVLHYSKDHQVFGNFLGILLSRL